MSWQADYLAALEARDQREQSNKALIDSYTKLADKSAKKVSSKSSSSSSVTASASQQRGPPSSPVPGIPRPLIPPGVTTSSNRPGSSNSHSGSTVTSLQADLGEAQRARLELEEQVAVLQAERDRARTQLRAEGQRARGLEAERTALNKKLRDRDEELRGKAKLLDDVQNEAVTLNLQLNVTEDNNRRLTAENKELVDRWMARMGEEADKMNLESKFS